MAAAGAPAGAGGTPAPAAFMVGEGPAARGRRVGVVVVPTRVSARRTGATGTRCENDDGRTAADGVDAGPGPTAFVALTVKVYAVSLRSPVRVADVADPDTVALAPAGEDVTV